MAARDIVQSRVPAAPTERREATLLQRLWRLRTVYLFLVPAFVSLIVFEYYPAFLAFKESFYDWDGFRIENFIGMANFTEMFKDPVFRLAVKNIFIIFAFQLTVPFLMPIVLAEAIFNLTSERMQKFWRVFLLIPVIVPNLVTLLLWQYLYNPVDGFLNTILHSLNMKPETWLGDPHIALRSYLFIGFPWASVTSMLIYLAGLQNIPQDVLDAAKLDGAGTWRRIFQIDLPLIRGQIKLFALLTIIETFQRYVFIYILTEGGPANATMVPGVYLFLKAFQSYRLGYASAVGLVMFLFILILTLVNNVLLKSDDSEPRETGIV